MQGNFFEQSPSEHSVIVLSSVYSVEMRESKEPKCVSPVCCFEDQGRDGGPVPGQCLSGPGCWRWHSSAGSLPVGKWRDGISSVPQRSPCHLFDSLKMPATESGDGEWSRCNGVDLASTVSGFCDFVQPSCQSWSSSNCSTPPTTLRFGNPLTYSLQF